jgi:DNA-binding NtrC family response regulator/tetratricopeptide (TPR) repeat protein
VEHPVIPIPQIDGGITPVFPNGERVSAGDLSRKDRLSLALQLTAAASLLAEFDLWPGRAAIRDAVFVRTQAGVQAVLGGFGLPMSRVFARLRGGEGAAASTRAAVVDAISRAVGLSSTLIDVGRGEPGFFLEGAISRQVRELRRPLDRCAGRSLWAFRWDGLPHPDSGAIDFWRVPIPTLAQRLGTALWADLRRRGRSAWLWSAGDEGGLNTPVPASGADGTIILIGEISRDELAALSRWTLRRGCSAVAIGGFPTGWHAPRPPGFDSQKIHRHLAVTGVSLEDARHLVDQRNGRIDPLERVDRNALTDSGCRVFSGVVGETASGGLNRQINQLAGYLALAPDGLPSGFIALHSGLSKRAIENQRLELEIVERDDVWRLADPITLDRDSRHTAIAGLYEGKDPRHLLHRALGSGDPEGLEAWVRERLDNLDWFPVRDLLAVVDPGALGNRINILYAEACLSALDLSGARRAISAMPVSEADALVKWLHGIDIPPGSLRQIPDEEQIEHSPMAVAEAAVLVLNQHRRRGEGPSEDAKALLDLASIKLSGLLRRRYEIELAWIADGRDFNDGSWRRRVVGRHPALRAQYCHRRALQLMDRKKTRHARRLLGLLATDNFGPGFTGAIENDRGAAALDAGDSFEADGHQLRAYRLLQMAGFQHLTRKVLFNLAVADLDQLEIERAQARFSELAIADPHDPYIAGEQARLYLAQGDLTRFREQLGDFSSAIEGNPPPFSDALCLLQGVASLLNGELARAHALLQRAGQEGEAWIGLVDTIAGRDSGSWLADAWGVSIAAELVFDSRNHGGGGGVLDGIDKMTKQQAFAVALAERASRRILPVAETMRVEAIQILRESGMDGWASALSHGSPAEVGVVESLAEIVNSTGPEKLAPRLETSLLNALGVTGLELRDSGDGRLIWNVGTGTPGTEFRHGRIIVVPLGGEADGKALWRLLAGVFDLLEPAHARASEADVEETGFYGISPAAVAVRRELVELGPSHLPVLIVGETGVGKEVAARALHRLSGRSGAFVAVNVAAIPSSLLEAELFGSVKGAFTGADRSRRGLVVAADRGTLFLDEVGDLDPPLQVKLLRFLEDQEVRAVGATQSTQVDVRILSATHQDLNRRVQEGRFRQDLYYRIAAPPLAIPPLRDRREDIGLLRDLFERQAAARHGLLPTIWSQEADSVLRRYHWPGNVRELRHAIEVAMVRAAGAAVRPTHLPISATSTAPPRAWNEAQQEFRREFLKAALARNGGNRSATAREIGISRQALLYHLRNLGIRQG